MFPHEHITPAPANAGPEKGGRELIRSSERLRDFERSYAAAEQSQRSYRDALDIFAALWRYARQMNPAFPGGWEQDVEPDIELARVLNGLPQER